MAQLDPEIEADHLGEEIGRRSRRGGSILVAAQVLRMATQMIAVVVLARLLSPATFGLLAMVASLAIVLDLVRELGLSTATIQREGLVHAQVNALFWVNVGAGAAMGLLIFLFAPLIAAFYHQPELVGIARWLALGFALNGLSTQHWALMRRQMKFGSIAILEAGGEIFGLCLAIGLAIHGAGIWALLTQRLTPVVITLIGSWAICSWRPTRPGGFKDVQDMVLFGLSVSGSSVLNTMARGVDQILIGWMWGPAALGLYERASKLLLVPLNNINIPLYTVALPALSRLVSREQLYRGAIFALFERLAMVTMPGAALVAVTGDYVCSLLFGPQWMSAAPIVTCFGVAAISQPVIIAAGLLYVPQGRPKELFRASLIDSALCIASFLIGLPWGAVGVATSFAAIGLSVRLPLSFWLATRVGPVRYGELCATVYPALIASVAVAGAVGALHVLANEVAPESVIGDSAAAIITAIIVVGATYMLIPRSRRTLLSFVRIAPLVQGTSKP